MNDSYRRLSAEDKIYNLNLTKQNLIQKKERLEKQIQDIDQKILKLQNPSSQN